MEKDDLNPSFSDNSTKKDIEDITFGEYLDHLCNYYMALGMTCDEFWYGDYCNFKYYKTAFELRRKQENEKMWIMGKYVASALLSTVCNQLQGKQGEKIDYPAEPFPLTREEAIKQEQRRMQAKEEKFYNAVMGQIALMNSNMSEKGDN